MAKTALPPSPLLLEILSALFERGPNTIQALHLHEQWPKVYTEQYLKTRRQRPNYLMFARILTYEHEVARAWAEQRFTPAEQLRIVKAYRFLFSPEERAFLISSGKRGNRRQTEPLRKRIHAAWEEEQAPRRERYQQLSRELKTFLSKETGREEWLKDRVRRLRENGLLPKRPPPPFAGTLWRNRAELLEDQARELQDEARQLRARDRLARAKRAQPAGR